MRLAPLLLLLGSCGFTPRDAEGRKCFSRIEDVNDQYHRAVCSWKDRCDTWVVQEYPAEECVDSPERGNDFVAFTFSCVDGCLVPACLDSLRRDPCVADFRDYPACHAVILAQGANECLYDACAEDSGEWCWLRQAEDEERMREGG